MLRIISKKIGVKEENTEECKEEFIKNYRRIN